MTEDDIPVLKKINAVLVKVPSIQEGLDFYHEQLGLQTFWKKEDIASVHVGDGQLVMSTTLDPETNILVESVEHAARVFEKAGGKVVSPPEDIDVGKVAIVEDAFGNKLTLVDFSKGFYEIDESGNVVDAATIKREKNPHISLEELVKGITPENIHGEVDWGEPVGNEIW